MCAVWAELEAGGRGRLLAIMGDLIVVLLAVIIGMNFSGNGSIGSSDNIVVKADEMLEDYIRDQGSAEKKYRGKNIPCRCKSSRPGYRYGIIQRKAILSMRREHA